MSAVNTTVNTGTGCPLRRKNRLEVLREQNRRLLTQVKRLRKKLDQPRAEVMVTRTAGDRGPARAALARPSVRFADPLELHGIIQPIVSAQSGTSKRKGASAEPTTPSDHLNDNYSKLQVGNRLQDTRPIDTKSCQSDAESRVTFQSNEDEDEDNPASRSRRLQPLLGYDWIAGVLDSEDSVVERPDEFFNELRVFRSLNKDECVHDSRAGLFEEGPFATPLLTDEEDREATANSHQCTFSYRINSRLFPVPLHSQEGCSVCQKPKSSHPHTAAEPALIRVSIPRAAILPPYKYKPHRRCSFDPSDSLGLPSHCLSGWSNTAQKPPPPPSSLDLRSSLKAKSSESALNMEREGVPAAKGGQTIDQIADVSRLPRYNFQHFSIKRKLGSRLLS